jgi:hypothetical protein
LNQLTTLEHNQITAGFDTQAGFELLQRQAKALASTDIVPKRFQNHIPNCIIALDTACRLKASPLLVMQNLYVVHGNPSWSAKFLISTFNHSGRFTAIRYDWVGEKGTDEWGCKAWATEKQTNDKIEGPWITLALAKKEGWYEKTGSKWKTIPELMLMYRSAAWLVNTHAPEISMGLSTAEEMHDVYDANQIDGSSYAVEEINPVEEKIAQLIENKSKNDFNADFEAEVIAAEKCFDKETGEIKQLVDDPF